MQVIQFSTDAIARAVYTDGLPLAELGPLRLQRASNVEFNETSQRWEVRLASNPDTVAHTDRSRCSCIAWEVEYLNRSMLES
jgi:hypothetical protein